jgi:hypothetical protein
MDADEAIAPLPTSVAKHVVKQFSHWQNSSFNTCVMPNPGSLYRP